MNVTYRQKIRVMDSSSFHWYCTPHTDDCAQSCIFCVFALFALIARALETRQRSFLGDENIIPHPTLLLSAMVSNDDNSTPPAEQGNSSSQKLRNVAAGAVMIALVAIVILIAVVATSSSVDPNQPNTQPPINALELSFPIESPITVLDASPPTGPTTAGQPTIPEVVNRFARSCTISPLSWNGQILEKCW